ncbi:hypothetical protein ACIPH4_39790 [Streptomyces tendae]|uniref:hypothetical protein n=1 Tax=Streptomyces tendae TaxID=1932 RepID=UPI0038274BE2
MSEADKNCSAGASLSRRSLLAAGVAGSALLITPELLATPAAAATELAHLPSQSEIWRDVVAMNDLGPRYTGNAAHKKFTGRLDAEFARLGLKVEHLNRDALTLWEPTHASLKTAHGTPIEVGATCRWSATTGPHGVTAPVQFCGRAEGSSFFSGDPSASEPIDLPIPPEVSGKIALVEMPSIPVPFGEIYEGTVKGFVDPTHAGPIPAVQPFSPAWTTIESRLPTGYEAKLRAAGAVGVIYAWTNGVDADAHGQFRRTGTEELPSCWVGMTAAKKLRSLADRGASVTLRIQAKVTQNVPTATTVATLPGKSDEVILLWTHTDGMNAVEENGSVAMLNLMRHFAKLPLAERNRTIVCVLTEGHFGGSAMADDWWIAARPDIANKAVVALAMEHLGCREWLSDPARNIVKPAHRPDIAWAYTLGPKDAPNGLVPVMLEALRGSRAARTAVIDRAAASITPATYLWNKGKIPTIGYISFNTYFLAEGRNGHIDKLDPDQLYDQVRTLGRAISTIDRTPRAELRP